MLRKTAASHHRNQLITQTDYNLLDQFKLAIESVTSKPAQQSGKGYRLQCPAHGGNNRNLYIADGDKRLIIICHSRHCDPKDIMESVGLTISDVFYEKLNPKQAKEFKAKLKTRTVIEELDRELITITLWITDFSEGVYPRNGEDDRSNCKQSFRRIQKALRYLEPEL